MNTKKLFCAISIPFSTLLLPIEALARAGGGGGGGSGGSWIGIILLPFFLIYLAILHYKLRNKNKEARGLLEKLSKHEASWGIDFIKSGIEKVFFVVQKAWMERNQDIANNFISQRLYDKHKLQTDSMLKKGHKNILESINLIEARIVEVADYENDLKDRFWAYIKGSMIDYTIDEKTGELVSGEKNKIEEFTELWKFIRGKGGWVLDEIDQKVGILDLGGFKSFSEEIKNID
jgi:hypothetical protein